MWIKRRKAKEVCKLKCLTSVIDLKSSKIKQNFNN